VEWRQLRNKELHNMSTSSDTGRVIKLSGVGGTEHEARMPTVFDRRT
jgi:hypothetical protein